MNVDQTKPTSWHTGNDGMFVNIPTKEVRRMMKQKMARRTRRLRWKKQKWTLDQKVPVMFT